MKKGISVIMLVVVIAIIAILTTIIIVSSTDVTNNSKLNNFATNMVKIQDAVTSYYAIRGTLPILNNTTVFTKSELLNVVEDDLSSALSTEIDNNGDSNSEFYYVDVEKLGLETLALEITPTSNSLVVNSEGTHVYYLPGYVVDEKIYFSITNNM